MNTRALAAQIIYTVCFEGVSLTEAFDAFKIPVDDRAFVKEMCFGTLRFWLTLQAILNDLLEKPLKKEDKDIECLLCIGLYQIFYMHVPSYALVDETVSATRILKKSWASKLMNKILRMAIEKKESVSGDASQCVKGVTATFSHPNWIIEKLQKAYPNDWEKILQANNEKAPLFLRVNQTKISRADFMALLEDAHLAAQAHEILPQCVLIKEPLPVEKIPGFYEGYFSVQDASGQEVMQYLDLASNQVVLDACAAPGSKTTHILEAMPTLQKCVAVDLYATRLSKVRENIARLKLNSAAMDYCVADICDLGAWWHGEKFDRILLDAPCSASGVIRRHPDIKILRKKTDIARLATTQLKILETLWPLLKENGKLIYTTCSVFPDENHEVIQAFLKVLKNVKVLFEKQNVTGWQDGFYYAVLARAQDPCTRRDPESDLY